VATEARETSASVETRAEAEAVETSPQPSQTACIAEPFCATANAEPPLDIYEALAWRHALSTGQHFDREAHWKARAEAEARLDEMQGENERPRDWWTRPPDGWPERITLRSALTGETTTIQLQRNTTSEFEQ